MGEIIYNGRSSKSIGVEVETFPDYQSPKRSYDKLQVPGRNGDLIIDNGRWENVTRTYLIAIGSYDIPYYQFMNKVSEWLHSSTTYAKLEDSYEPDYYRLAVYLEEVTMTNLFNHGGEANISFDCKPQRFLKIGDDVITLTQKTTKLLNPTLYPSLPIIKVYGTGSGSLTINNCTVTITDIGTSFTLDSEIQDAYNGLANWNSKIKLTNGFPVLQPRYSTVSFSGGISKLEVTPKWFTL